MCKCVNVEIGSHGNQVIVSTPEHMKQYRRLEASGCTDKEICIDACVADEVQSLWAQGITTTGCCCGHNKLPGFIGVIDSDIARMKEMGYKVQHNLSKPGDEDSFYLKN